jgi:hypothetical protein
MCFVLVLGNSIGLIKSNSKITVTMTLIDLEETGFYNVFNWFRDQ